MIKRAIKELCTERRLVLGGVCACFACIYALSVLGTGAGLCTPCIMDAFALASRRMTGTVGKKEGLQKRHYRNWHPSTRFIFLIRFTPLAY